MPDEPVFDDGSEVEVVIEEDDPPSSGVWVDNEQDGVFDLSQEEAEAGDFLGQVIDVDDDEDDGLQWGTIEEPVL